MRKTPCIYENHNPNGKGVAFVAIQTDTVPPYVWATYGRGELAPKLCGSMTIMSIEAARNVFDFKEGKLADIARKRSD